MRRDGATGGKSGWRLVAVLCALALLTSSCSLFSGDDNASTTDGLETSAGEGDDSPSTTAAPEETTTTTLPPVVLALSPNLALTPGQCYDSVPAPIETTTTTTPLPVESIAGQETTTTSTTISTTTTEPPSPTTTLPRPPTVAVVDCNGTRRGVVYSIMCLGSLAAKDDLVIDRPEDLGQVGCPGEIGLDWPGDRLLRRAGARVCLGMFESIYGETYALSEITTEEFVPSKGVWALGDRRLVCAASEPPP